MANRVLIIDDNELTLELVSKILEIEGYKVDVACNAKDAIDHLQNEKPDLVIMDVMMPEMNGYDLCRKLRQKPYNIKIPILIMTAEGNDQDKERALNCGANDLLTKPFNLDALRERIKDLILQ